MSTNNKARGGQASELTRLKQLDADKQEVVWSWRQQTADGKPLLTEQDKPATNAQIRNRLASTFGIRLSRDKQLSEFWRWYAAQEELEQSNDLISQFEEFTRTQNPNWSPDKVREMGIQFFMAHTMSQKSATQFATIVTLDQNERFGRTKAEQKNRELKLREEQFQVKACEFFLSWFNDQRAKDIANGAGTNAEKIAALRKTYFKSVDELQASGTVKLPE